MLYQREGSRERGFSNSEAKDNFRRFRTSVSVTEPGFIITPIIL